MPRLQPNSRHCFVCGLANDHGLKLRFYETGPGEVTATFTAPDYFQGYPGVLHGGIVAAILDEVTGRTLIGADPPRFMYTARLEIKYRRNVPVGEPLRLVGRAGKSRRNTATASGEIYSENGELLAEADILLVDVPTEVVDSTDLEGLGWKVYDEDYDLEVS